MKEIEKKKRFIGWPEVVFAVFYAVFVTCGRSVYNYNTLADMYYRPLEYGALFLFVLIPMIFVLAFVGAGVRKASTAGPEEDKARAKIYRFFPLITALLVIASGVLALLAYFPGILGYDSKWQTQQALGILPLSNHHPVLHTLIWNLFIALEWAGVPHPYGLVIYCIVQILILGIVCGFVTDAQVKAGCRWPVLVVTMLFYALYPAFSVFSVEMTKDVLFSCIVISLILRLNKAGTYESDPDDEEQAGLIARKEKLNLIGISVLTALGCLFRNNHLPAAAVLVIVLFFMWKKKGIKKLIAAVFTGVVVAVAVMKGIYPLCGVEKTESHELLSVPINQISSVYVKHFPDLTVAEKFLTDNYMDSGKYNPRLADSVKFTFNDELYDSDRSAFWDLYLHMFVKYPQDFTDAFLTQNVQLWYPGARVTDRYSARKYVETESVAVPEYFVTESPVLPGVRGFYDMILDEVEKSGIIGGLPFSLSIPFYVIILAFYIAVRSKRSGYAAGVFLAFFLWGTYLLGPVAAFRYMYPFYLLIPVFLIPVFAWGNTIDEDKN